MAVAARKKPVHDLPTSFPPLPACNRSHSILAATTMNKEEEVPLEEVRPLAIDLARPPAPFSLQRRLRDAGHFAGPARFRDRNYCRSNGWNFVWKSAFAIVLVVSVKSFFLRRSSDDPFAQPFCSADGVCHENPDEASPRTIYSAWNKNQYDLWFQYYGELKELVNVYAEKRQKLYDGAEGHANARRTRPLILLGDSITEAWSGTGLGIRKARAEGVPEVLERTLTSSSLRLDPIVLGVSGDQTQHLLHRLERDHMRAAQLHKSSTEGKTMVRYDPSTIFVAMIGTNNLGSGELPGPTAKGILAVVDYILTETAEAGCHVMLFGVLPRGDGPRVLPTLCPPRCSDVEERVPFSSFMPAVVKTNEAVAEGIRELSKTHPGRIAQVDCGAEFLNEHFDKEKTKGEDNYEVKKELMPDLLHPNAMGHEKLAQCIKDYVNEIDARK